MGLDLLTLEFQERGIQSVCEGRVPISASYPLVATLVLFFPSDGSRLGGKGGRKESGMCLKGASFSQWELYGGWGLGGGSAGETT